jgi:predicted nucleic-acid-binding Zn-ribbon protein
MSDQEKCPKCEGCGEIANDEDGLPWTHWQELPTAASFAIRLGLIFPIECPECGGTGKAKKERT